MESTRMTTDTFLRDVGLNEKEVEIYGYLAKNGPQKALSIARILRMHKMQVYRYLDSMQKKGVISLAFEDPKRFAAAPIEKLVTIKIRNLEGKLLNIEKSREKILSYSGFSVPAQNQLSTFSIVQGKEKVEGLFSEVLNRAVKEICVVTSSENLSKLIVSASNDCPRKASAEVSSRYVVQVSTSDGAKSTSSFLKTLIATGCQLRQTAAGKEKLPDLAIADDKEAVLMIEESSMTLLWTDNALIICVIKGFFEKLWTDTAVSVA